MKKKEFILDFINCYFRLFHAKIEDVNFKNNDIMGKIIWEDTNEFQDFLWNIPKVDINYKNVIELINYLIKNNLIDGDKIIISKDHLVNNLKKLRWDISKIHDVLFFLCSIRIAMIDEGKVTDYFFVHF
ncbi:MAG: hypothetical protein K1060chlam4_01575 [Candidatus Anoxychlamydiales bacterium]|nr:hypothetical protein [Candidatus Anoxychlamydiales bacterium]